MKKIAISSVVISLFAAPAFAEVSEASLTTKGYVDAGLRAVNGNVTSALTLIGEASDENGNGGSGLIHDIETLDADIDGLTSTVNGLNTTVGGLNTSVNSLNTAVGDANSGLIKAVADNAADIEANTQAIEALQNQNMNYNEGDGIDIDTTTRTISVDGLDTTKEQGNQNKQYVYKNGQLQEIDVVTTWDSSVLD